MALPFFTASFRSAASDWRELLIASKAAEEGNVSAVKLSLAAWTEEIAQWLEAKAT